MSDKTWLAEFVHPQHPWRDFVQTLPGSDGTPPATIRRPGYLAGMPASDVYLLTDSSSWPSSSIYTYSQSVLGGVRDGSAPESDLDLEDSAPVRAEADEAGPLRSQCG